MCRKKSPSTQTQGNPSGRDTVPEVIAVSVSTSFQKGLIREDSSLAVTFLLILIHNTKECRALEALEALPALVSAKPPPGNMTQPEHMLN